jgi:Flp pilus assembly protein TadB
MTWIPVVCLSMATALLVSGRPQWREPEAPAASGSTSDPSVGWLHRHRLLWAALVGLGGAVFVQGRIGPAAGVIAAVVTWVVIGRAEPADVRRRREEVRRDLPYVVDLFAATLRSGAAPGDGIGLVCAALPGAAAQRLAGIAARLALGLDPVEVWSSLAGDPQLGRLGRALARAQATGAPIVPAVERLADDLARGVRADTEEQARAVGVKAALPLGLCLLPAFILTGIVPLVVALLADLDL